MIMERYPNKKEGAPKSFIKIGREHNLKALLALLQENGIEVTSVVSWDPRLDAVEQVSGNYIPSLSSRLQVIASYDDIRSILEKSEFRGDLDGLIGSVLKF